MYRRVMTPVLRPSRKTVSTSYLAKVETCYEKHGQLGRQKGHTQQKETHAWVKNDEER